MTKGQTDFDVTTRVLHLGLAVFGTAAWWLGDDADDYHKAVHDGYTLHMCAGLGFSLFLALRIGYGVFGPAEQRFANWMPFTRERLAAAWADIRGLCQRRLPPPLSHRGLSGAIQGIGLVLFTWQGASGSLMSLTLTPGERATGWVHDIKEVHGLGGNWIPAYLALHVGAMLLHSFAGHPIWKKMIFVGK